MSLWSVAGLFLLRHWFIGLLILGSIGAWILTSFRPVKIVAWVGLGLLAGIALSLITLKTFLEQYLTPVMICLALFVPYLYLLVKRFRWHKLLTLILLVATIGSGIRQVNLRRDELLSTAKTFRNPATESFRGIAEIRTGPAIEALYNMQKILELIPENERIVAMWNYHPIFRFDQTFITYDVRPSFIQLINPSDKVYQYFQPEYFAKELKNHPPAYICLFKLKDNYPPGWLETCIDFLRRNRTDYVEINIGGVPVYVRCDLLE